MESQRNESCTTEVSAANLEETVLVAVIFAFPAGITVDASHRDGNASAGYRAPEVAVMRLSTMGIFTIGRDLQASLPLDALGVSRHHAEIMFADGHFHLRDCSTNGTFLNGEYLEQHSMYALNLGDQIRIGPAMIYMLPVRTTSH